MIDKVYVQIHDKGLRTTNEDTTECTDYVFGPYLRETKTNDALFSTCKGLPVNSASDFEQKWSCSMCRNRRTHVAILWKYNQDFPNSKYMHT